MAYSDIFDETSQDFFGAADGRADKAQGLPRPEEANLVHTDPKKRAYYVGYNRSYPPPVAATPPPPPVQVTPPPPPVQVTPRPPISFKPERAEVSKKRK